MKQKSMTALISAFSRAYHRANNSTVIFDDPAARALFSDKEYSDISHNLSAGIKFFDPDFSAIDEQALRFVVDSQLSPAVLGRSAFAEGSLKQAVRLGASQYLIFAAGYDTFAYRQPLWAADLEIFELDLAATSADKAERIKKAGLGVPVNLHRVDADLSKPDWPGRLLGQSAFIGDSISFCNLLGLSYYLKKSVFCDLLAALGRLLAPGSSLVFDYPDELFGTERGGIRSIKQAQLAAAAGEKMTPGYSYRELEAMLAAAGFLIYEQLDPAEMTASYFSAYNRANPAHSMTAFDNVNYCLAVKNGAR